MTISYPLSFPDNDHVAQVTLRTINAVAISQSPFTFVQQAIAHTGQRWEADIKLRAMRRAEAEVWLGFLTSLKGSLGTFLLGDPRACTPLGSAGGTPLVSGASQTGSSLVLDGATSSQTGWLKAGDYIQLGTGSLHKVLADADSDGGGNVTLDIWPDLRSSPANNAVVTVTSTVGTFRLIGPGGSWSADNMSAYSISFSAVEALT